MNKKLMFIIIGVINTTVDMGIYTMLVSMHIMTFFWANLISTIVGIFCSFLLNSKYTFKSHKKSKKTFALYFAITAIGLWVIQPVVIWLTKDNIPQLPAIINFDVVITLIPKAIATCVTLVWNYVLYDKIVFQSATESKID